MTLKELKDHIESFPFGNNFEYGITKPFSWRGSYDEVAFAIVKSPMTREEVLENIELAYNNTFFGYKGGEYRYEDWTTVNFEEEGSRNYSDGGYVARMISEIENGKEYKSQEERLVNLIFN